MVRKFSVFRALYHVAAIFFLVSEASAEPKKHTDWSFYSLGLTPVQNGGRIKPLDSFAREIVLFQTGSRNYQGWNSVDLLLSWVAHPKEWEDVRFIPVGREDVRRQLSLDEKRVLYSPRELLQNSNLAQYAEQMTGSAAPGAEPPGAPRTPARDQELKAVLDRVGVFHGLITGQNWLLIPQPAPAAWLSVIDPGPEGELIRNEFFGLVTAYHGDDLKQFERASHLLRAAVEGEIPGYRENLRNKVIAESLYQKIRPFLSAWIFYLLAGLLWIGCQVAQSAEWSRWPRKFAARVAWSFTGLAFLSHAVGIVLRCYVAGRPPVTNMYESVIWVSLGIVIFAMVLYAIHRRQLILSVACWLALSGLIAGDSVPAVLDPALHPLVPVLRSNYWLTVHVLTITLGYAAFALALGFANITLFQFSRRAKPREIGALNQLTYRAIQFGVVFIAAGTILGGIWADYSWGRFWGWDPKEVWALITLLAYLVILHGRYANWVGAFGFAAWSAVSFLTVLMAWYGVNFVLGVGLHSYGFSKGGTPWVLGFAAIQMAYVGIVTALHWKNQTEKRQALAASSCAPNLPYTGPQVG